MSSKRYARMGFTLIELLVVVAVIALLLGLLLPSLTWSREVAQSMVGSSNVRQLTVGQLAHAAENDGWVAGPNTTGLLVKARGQDSITGGSYDTAPTSTHDWISPTVGASLGFSPNRAERTRNIFEQFACPKATYQYNLVYALSSPDDIDDFEDEQQKRPYLQLSYLAPSPFLYVNPSSAWRRTINGVQFSVQGSNPTSNNRRETSIFIGFGTPFRTPKTYRPRLDLLKNPSSKAAVADGTRYVEYRGGREPTIELDFDADPAPSIYGSFLSASPAFHGSRAYGRNVPGANGNTFNIDISMRYFGNNNEMHVAHWDGHSERIAKEEAWSNPVRWYPRGSTYSGSSGTPEINEIYEEGERLP